MEVVEKPTHRDRKERWARLGDRLGFKVRKEFEEKGSRCDVVWRDNFGGKLVDESLWIPIIAIEIETQSVRKIFKGDILGFNTLKPMLGIIHMVKSGISDEEFRTLWKSVQLYIDTQAQVRVKIFTDQNLEDLERKAMMR